MSDDGWTEPGAPGPEIPDSEPGAAPASDRLPVTLTKPGLVPRPTASVAANPATAPRRDARVGPPPRHPQWLVNQLPVGMLQSEFFVRFVSLFQELGGSLLDGADLLEFIPDMAVSPTPMLSGLAGWIGVDAVDASLPEHLQRLILASSAKALAHRGTARGLREYLGMLSGGPAEVADGGGVWPEGDAPADVAWVRMRIQSTGHLSEDEFVAMIRDEIPAHVRAELWIEDRRVLNTAEEN